MHILQTTRVSAVLPRNQLETEFCPSPSPKQAQFYIGRSEFQRYEGLSREHSTMKFHVRDELEPINHNTN
jgi:hypothetical protein